MWLEIDPHLGLPDGLRDVWPEYMCAGTGELRPAELALAMAFAAAERRISARVVSAEDVRSIEAAVGWGTAAVLVRVDVDGAPVGLRGTMVDAGELGEVLAALSVGELPWTSG